MIARTWHGAVPADKSDAYHAYLLRTGVADYRAVPGNRGVYVLRRRDAEAAHFLLLTLWDDLAALRAFAGDDVERAHYYPEDEAFLLELEPTVTHYAVPVEPAGLEPGTVARLWRGFAAPAQADAYEHLLRAEVFPGIEARRIAGYRGIGLLRNDRSGDAAFVTVMSFDGAEALRSFAGDDPERAVVPASARALLRRFDDRARHYDVLDTTNPHG